MITTFIKSTVNIFKFFFKCYTKKTVTEAAKPIQPIVEPIQPVNSTNVVTQKDKILFQPNTILTQNYIEFPSLKKETEIPVNEESVHKLTLECNKSAIIHLNGLCRFFEINQFDAIARGIWILSIIRDIEINNKKLGIISIDQNGFVTDITPINMV